MPIIEMPAAMKEEFEKTTKNVVLYQKAYYAALGLGYSAGLITGAFIAFCLVVFAKYVLLLGVA